ncbi:hypothetical protein IW261DRAFT_1566350 [Armillaria novae-zelandiae]|uniref:Uncharacterized protein n=1 Tax=Armillaria novae-zelandiae TaxID=153914 RepID=A0AA39P4Q4_9AGAR|nr:hypothetical protein IW261DRAFT_1566350 [Armillaria novae-zelandiae]
MKRQQLAPVYPPQCLLEGSLPSHSTRSTSSVSRSATLASAVPSTASPVSESATITDPTSSNEFSYTCPPNSHSDKYLINIET